MSWRVAPAGRSLYSSFWVSNSKSLTLRRRSSPRVSHRGAAVPHLSRQGLLPSDAPRRATKRDSVAACGRSIFLRSFRETRSLVANLAYERSFRSALKYGLNTSKTRRRPLLSHSSQRPRSARCTVVAAQLASKTRSAGQDLSASSVRLNCEGASAIQESHEMKLMSPPRLRDVLLSTASFRKV